MTSVTGCRGRRTGTPHQHWLPTVVVLDTAVLWVQMGQPPAQGSGVDVEGTRRAALPIGC